MQKSQRRSQPLNAMANVGINSSSSDTSVGMGWTPGGLTFSARGRF